MAVLKRVTMLETRRKLHSQRQSQKVETNCCLKPSWMNNGSVKTDLPLTVIGKKKRRLIETICTGQLFCVGKVYLKTHEGTVRIR